VESLEAVWGRQGLLHLIMGISLARASIVAHLFIILLQSGQIFTGLRELAFLHSFANIPLDESTLGIHQIELGINAREDLGDGSGVGKHADGTLDLGHFGTWDNRGRSTIYATFESSWAPVYELNGRLLLDGAEGRADVLGQDVATVHEARRHVLSEARLALAKSVLALEDGVRNLGDGVLLVEGLVGGDDGGVGRQQEVNTRIGDQVGLELVKIHVERAFEAKGAGKRRNDLSNQSVQVAVGRTWNI